MSPADIKRRDPALVLLASLFSCGLYLVYWYFQTYDTLKDLGGQTPTGNDFWLDFALHLVTCGLYGVWVDYKISQQLYELQRSSSTPQPNDTSTIAVVFDLFGYVTFYFANFVSSAIHQDQLNKLLDHLGDAGARTVLLGEQ